MQTTQQFEHLRQVAIQLINNGQAYIDFGQPVTEHNPHLDRLYFESYCLQQVGNWRSGVLRLLTEPDHPIIYQRIDGKVLPTEFFIKWDQC